MSQKQLVKRLTDCSLKTELGEFKMFVYGDAEGKEHVALVKGKVEKKKSLPCRVHSSCLAGEAFHATTCSCHKELMASMKLCQDEGSGIVIYLNQHGGGGGISSFVKQMKEGSLSSDKRNYQIAAEILRDLKVKSVRLMTDNPQKVKQLKRYGVKVVETISS